MNSNDSHINDDLRRWPRRQWILVFLLILTLQVALLVWGSAPVFPRSVYPSSPLYSFAPPPSPAPASDEYPMLFASAHRHGFSSAAWMRQPLLPNPTREIMPPPRYLDYALAQRLLPPPSVPSFQLQFTHRLPLPDASPEPRQHSSAVRIDGALSQRPLLDLIPVPLQHHTDVLNNSVVEISVDADGLVVAARLIESSGLRKADQEALILARKARFAPVPSASNSPASTLSWGRLIFDWFVVHSAPPAR